jgi:hypothetical protein
MDITSPSGQIYTVMVEKPLGATDTFNLYQCILPDTRVCILKIASSIEHNGLLDREAYLLQTMQDEAASLEKEYVSKKKGDKMLNYQLLFPKLIESFIDPGQDKRRINVLSLFENTDDEGNITSIKLEDDVPLSHLESRERVYIDHRTSAWILGKLIKLLSFAHALGISLGEINSENIILNRDQHYVALFDWSNATMSSGKVSPSVISEELSQLANEIIRAMGGNPETGKLLSDDEFPPYADFLRSLSLGKETDAFTAHEKFYELIRALWPREFYPFTVNKIN